MACEFSRGSLEQPGLFSPLRDLSICFSADSVAITKPPGANQLAAKSSQRRCRTAGVYWIAVYDILEAAGLDVYLVNARDTKSLPGARATCRKVSG